MSWRGLHFNQYLNIQWARSVKLVLVASNKYAFVFLFFRLFLDILPGLLPFIRFSWPDLGVLTRLQLGFTTQPPGIRQTGINLKPSNLSCVICFVSAYKIFLNIKSFFPLTWSLEVCLLPIRGQYDYTYVFVVQNPLLQHFLPGAYQCHDFFQVWWSSTVFGFVSWSLLSVYNGTNFFHPSR